MFQQTYSVFGDVRLKLTRGGADIALLGTDESNLRVQGAGNAEDYNLTWENGTLTLNADEDCLFSVPRAANITVRGPFGDLRATELRGRLDVDGGAGDVALHDVRGDVTLGDVPGDLKAQEIGNLKVTGRIHGDALIREAGQVELRSVLGDARARDCLSLSLGEGRGDVHASDVAGDVNITEAGGDVKLREVRGAVNLARVGGDVLLDEVEGSVHVSAANGDAVLALDFAPEQTCAIVVSGDIVLRLDEDASARFEAQAGGEVKSRANLKLEPRAGGGWVGVLGGGQPLVNLQAGGDILFKSAKGENMEFRVEINREEMRRAQDEIKRAKEEVKHIKHTIRDAIRQARHGEREATHAFRFHVPHPPRPPRAPRPPRPPGDHRWGFNWQMGGHQSVAETRPSGSRGGGVSEEERLEILKMLQEKKITAEQAELLLNALGD